MLKIENYTDPSKMVTVWKLTISDDEFVFLDLTNKEREILRECMKPEAPISMVALGLALLAKKIEEKSWTEEEKAQQPTKMILTAAGYVSENVWNEHTERIVKDNYQGDV